MRRSASATRAGGVGVEEGLDHSFEAPFEVSAKRLGALLRLFGSHLVAQRLEGIDADHAQDLVGQPQGRFDRDRAAERVAEDDQLLETLGFYDGAHVVPELRKAPLLPFRS